jgi:hypothetical protein
MQKGFSKQLTRQVGEHLVVSKLGRIGFVAAPFAGNVPDYDILAADERNHPFPIQVKAINKGDWQLRADTLLDIKIGKSQKLKGTRRLRNPHLICIFILLRPKAEDDEFYTFDLQDLQKIVLERYKLRKPPQKVESTHFALSPNMLRERHFRDDDLSRLRDQLLIRG